VLTGGYWPILIIHIFSVPQAEGLGKAPIAVNFNDRIVHLVVGLTSEISNIDGYAPS
jgi:hypothetical protein